MDRRRDSILATWRHRHPEAPLPSTDRRQGNWDLENKRYDIALGALQVLQPAQGPSQGPPPYPQPPTYQHRGPPPTNQRFQRGQPYRHSPYHRGYHQAPAEGQRNHRHRYRRRNNPGPGYTPPGRRPQPTGISPLVRRLELQPPPEEQNQTSVDPPEVAGPKAEDPVLAHGQEVFGLRTPVHRVVGTETVTVNLDQ